MMVTTEFEANGTHASSPVPLGSGPEIASSGPRLPRREQWIDLPEQYYPGFRVKVWVNYPRRLNDELRSDEEPRVMAALHQIVLEHNGWRDTDGTPYPPATGDEFWHVIDNELAAVVIVLVNEQVGKLALSLRTRNGR